jgi:hypothetical protein
MAQRVLRVRKEETDPRRIVANILNMQLWTADRGGPSAWVLGEGLTTHNKKPDYYEMSHRTSERAPMNTVMDIWVP